MKDEEEFTWDGKKYRVLSGEPNLFANFTKMVVQDNSGKKYNVELNDEYKIEQFSEQIIKPPKLQNLLGLGDLDSEPPQGANTRLKPSSRYSQSNNYKPPGSGGGNHTTRKQRVRGIFKNSKTRRTY
jgi:hypothetical protein